MTSLSPPSAQPSHALLALVKNRTLAKVKGSLEDDRPDLMKADVTAMEVGQVYLFIYIESANFSSLTSAEQPGQDLCTAEQKTGLQLLIPQNYAAIFRTGNHG